MKIICAAVIFLLVCPDGALALEDCCVCHPVTDEMDVTTYQLQNRNTLRNGEHVCDWVLVEPKISGTFRDLDKCSEKLANICK